MRFIDVKQSNNRFSWQMTLLGQTALAFQRFAIIFVAGALFSVVFFSPNWYFGEGDKYFFAAVAAIVLFFSAVFAASRYIQYETWRFDTAEGILVYHIHSPIRGDEQYQIEFEDIKKLEFEPGGGLTKSSLTILLGDEDVIRTLLGGYFHAEIRTVVDGLKEHLADAPKAPSISEPRPHN